MKLRGGVTVILLIGAWLTWYRGKNVDDRDYAAINIPLRLTSGFTVKEKFRVEATAQFCLSLVRVSPEALHNTSDLFDPDGVLAEFEITSNGGTVVSGRYPPYVGYGRTKDGAYRTFGSFRGLPNQEYDLWFKIVQAHPSPVGKDLRLRIALDPAHFGKGKMLGLLFYTLVFAAIATGFPLLVRKRRGQSGVALI